MCPGDFPETPVSGDTLSNTSTIHSEKKISLAFIVSCENRNDQSKHNFKIFKKKNKKTNHRRGITFPTFYTCRIYFLIFGYSNIMFLSRPWRTLSCKASNLNVPAQKFLSSKAQSPHAPHRLFEERKVTLFTFALIHPRFAFWKG